MKTILALCQGRSVPSSRFRIKSIIPILKKSDVNLCVRDAHFSAYPPSGVLPRIVWFLQEVFFRIPDVFRSYCYDGVILQRELISTIPTLERFTKKPRILDVDDAIWLHRNGWAANSIAKNVDYIVCGNQYLADYFSSFGKPVSIIPTGVDVVRFVPRKSALPNRIIGWSGTSGGFRFLYAIEKILAKILVKHPSWKIRIVSDQKPNFSLISDQRLEFIPWCEEKEVSTIQEMDIGLMPLDDTAWSRGKCSYKMLLYMACGLPVVVSNFGMNSNLLAQKFIGYGAISEKDWFVALDSLINDDALRKKAGQNGRNLVVSNYSTDVVAKKWISVLDEVLNKN